MGWWAKHLTAGASAHRVVFLGLRCNFSGNSIFISLPFPMTPSHLSNAFGVLLTDLPAWSARRPCSCHWADATGTWLGGGSPDTRTGLARCPRAGVWLSSSADETLLSSQITEQLIEDPVSTLILLCSVPQPPRSVGTHKSQYHHTATLECRAAVKRALGSRPAIALYQLWELRVLF